MLYYRYNFTVSWNNQRYLCKCLSNYEENCRKVSWRYKQVSGKRKPLGVKREQNPP